MESASPTITKIAYRSIRMESISLPVNGIVAALANVASM